MITMQSKESRMEETYEDIKRLIRKMSYNACARFGGDVEDYVSASNEAFVVAYNTFDFTEGTEFSTWVWWKIRGAISSEVRRRSHSTREAAPTEDFDFAHCAAPVAYFWDRLLPELGADAQLVARMIVETPEEMGVVLKKKRGAAARTELSRRLRDLGWSWARVSESFTEIREALQ